MNQTFSVSLFAAGLPVFLGLTTEMLSNHPTWGSLLESPLGVVHLLVVGAAFVVLVIGAIGIQLPRSVASFGDRKDDHPAPALAAPAVGTTTTTTVTTENTEQTGDAV